MFDQLTVTSKSLGQVSRHSTVKRVGYESAHSVSLFLGGHLKGQVSLRPHFNRTLCPNDAETVGQPDLQKTKSAVDLDKTGKV